jgi:hypothetical protein
LNTNILPCYFEPLEPSSNPNPSSRLRTRFVVFEPVSSSSNPFCCLRTCSPSSNPSSRRCRFSLYKHRAWCRSSSRRCSVALVVCYAKIVPLSTSSSEEEQPTSLGKGRGGCGRSALGRALVNLCRGWPLNSRRGGGDAGGGCCVGLMGVSGGWAQKKNENQPQRRLWFVFRTHCLGLPVSGSPLAFLHPQILRLSTRSPPHPSSEGRGGCG